MIKFEPGLLNPHRGKRAEFGVSDYSLIHKKYPPVLMAEG